MKKIDEKILSIHAQMDGLVLNRKNKLNDLLLNKYYVRIASTKQWQIWNQINNEK